MRGDFGGVEVGWASSGGRLAQKRETARWRGEYRSEETEKERTEDPSLARRETNDVRDKACEKEEEPESEESERTPNGG